MTISLWCVFAAGLLPYIASFIAKSGAREFDNRDPREWLAKQGGLRQRADSAQKNGFEVFPYFAAAVLTAHLLNGPQPRVDVLALVFIAARVAYLPLYLFGPAALRSLVWGAGMAATIAIFLTAAL